MSGDGELMLSILASFAQEESLSVSENCKWRIRRDFAAGEGNSFDMYGYKIRGGEYEIVPEEADVVRKIYTWYLDGVGTGRIAIMLNAKQIPPCRGSFWNRTTIMSVLRKLRTTDLIQRHFSRASESPCYKGFLTPRGASARPGAVQRQKKQVHDDIIANRAKMSSCHYIQAKNVIL